MNMKKQLLPAFLVLGILLAGLSGCGEQTKPDTDNAQSPLETVAYANLTDGDSVSYTHLDVYKRQPMGRS